MLRVSLAFAFLFPAVNVWFDPSSWIGYFPAFAKGIVSDEILLHGFGAVEIILALWVLSGWKIVFPASVMALMLLAIVVFNISQFQITFRDLSIMGMAVALVVMEKSAQARKVPIDLEA